MTTEPTPKIAINIQTGPAPNPKVCTISPVVAGQLQTEHTHVYHATLREGADGREQFTPDLPDAPREHLNPQGLAIVGTLVGPGDVVIGRVQPQAAASMPEEQVLAKMLGREGPIRDTSVRVSVGVGGVVEAASIVDGRAEVTVRWTRPLERGDVLVDEAGHEAIVGDIGPLAEFEALWGSGGARTLSKQAIARDTLHARSIGPYSAVTQLPFQGRERFGGQSVSAATIASLVDAGLQWTAFEMLTLKADAVEERSRIYADIVQDKPLEPGATRRSAVMDVERLFEAIGLHVALDAASIEASWATTETVIARSHGAVKKPETFSPSTHLPETGGLFCPRIFGPIHSFRCACGALGMRQAGQVCEACGVESASTSVRRKRFGHIELPIPVVHPWRPDLQLEAIPVLPADLRPRVPLDDGRFATSDLNMLYRQVITQSHKVTRLMALDAPEHIVERECDSLQQAVSALFDNDNVTAPLRSRGRVLYSVHHQLQRSLLGLRQTRCDYSAVAHCIPDDALEPGICRLPRAMARELFKPWVFSRLVSTGEAGSVGEAKQAVDDRSAAAMTAVDDVAARAVVLMSSPQALGAARIELWEEPIVAVSSDVFSPVVHVHVPILPAAVDELTAVIGQVFSVADLDPRPSGWLSAAMAGGPLSELLADAAADPVSDPTLRLALGWWPAGGSESTRDR